MGDNLDYTVCAFAGRRVAVQKYKTCIPVMMSKIINYKPDTDNDIQSYADELVLRIRGNKVIEDTRYE